MTTQTSPPRSPEVTAEFILLSQEEFMLALSKALDREGFSSLIPLFILAHVLNHNGQVSKKDMKEQLERSIADLDMQIKSLESKSCLRVSKDQQMITITKQGREIASRIGENIKPALEIALQQYGSDPINLGIFSFVTGVSA